MNDAQIAAYLRAKLPGALAELFDAYGDRLFRYCWQMLRNREIAQIALRDTLLVAAAHIGRRRSSGSSSCYGAPGPGAAAQPGPASGRP